MRRRVADNQRAAHVLQSSRHDFAGGRAEMIDHDHQRAFIDHILVFIRQMSRPALLVANLHDGTSFEEQSG